MKILQKPMRGEIYYADLRGSLGSEQGGLRPVLILQTDLLNQSSPTTIVAPITSQIKRPQLLSHCLLRPEHPLKERSMVLCEQLRTVDCQRFGSYVGMLGVEDLRDAERALRAAL